MNDPRFIPPSDRDPDCLGWLGHCHWDELYERFCQHAAFMDERDARQRDLIRRLAEALKEDLEWCEAVGRDPCSTCKLVAEAWGVEATNE